MSGYTGGPWKDSGYDGVVFITHEGVPICRISTGFVAKSEWEANARLIAAAPELLEAAKLAESYIRSIAGGEGRRAHTRLVVAIAKAEGRADERESS
jgi:hypothetical protein